MRHVALMCDNNVRCVRWDGMDGTTDLLRGLTITDNKSQQHSQREETNYLHHHKIAKKIL
jgi:hypothetical protein